MGTRPPDRYLLFADGALALTVEEQCLRFMGAWLPTGAQRAEHAGRPAASIVVLTGGDVGQSSPPDFPPTLRIDNVRAWLDGDADTAILVGGSSAVGGIDLPGHRARLVVSPGADEAASAELQPMLTIAAALLLGRIGRILLHAGAVVASDGRAWLVVGDARSGKSTTCVSLAASGWGLLSDDQVVLRGSGMGNLHVEGWRRPLHLDVGWEDRRPTGARKTVAPAALGLRLAAGPIEIAGTLHTSVAAARPTTASMMPAGDAFIGLVRQSPWLLADRAAAPAIVDRLSALARLPRLTLSLGLDTFGRPDALRTVVENTLTRNGIA